MYISSLLVAAASCLSVAQADFLMVTEPPIPTSLLPTSLDSSGQASWTSSVFLNGALSLNPLTKSLSSTQSVLSSELSSFASAHSNYSVPAEAYDPSKTTTIVAAVPPPWYTAMPSDIRSFKEEEWKTIKSVLQGVIEARLTTTTGSKGAAPTEGPGLGAKWAMAAGAAAVFL